MVKNWKRVVGQRLKQLREQAQGGKGITHKRAAETIKYTEAYVVRLETHMEDENPTLKVLDQLCTLYGVTIGDLFEPLVPARAEAWEKTELHCKLDFLLAGPEPQRGAIVENIEAMFIRSKRATRQRL